jgi:hypothetical protein
VVRGASDLPPIVGSLFSWKSLLTKRRTRDDCRQRLVSFHVRRRWRFGVITDLADSSFTEQYQLDAAAWFRGVRIRHYERLYVDDSH